MNRPGLRLDRRAAQRPLPDHPVVVGHILGSFGWPLHVIDGAADDPPIEQPEPFTAAVIAGDHQN